MTPARAGTTAPQAVIDAMNADDPRSRGDDDTFLESDSRDEG